MNKEEEIEIIPEDNSLYNKKEYWEKRYKMFKLIIIQ